MTQDDIARMAREAGDDWDSTLPADKAFLERFAALAIAAEREACAKVADKWIGCDGLAAAIRERLKK